MRLKEIPAVFPHPGHGWLWTKSIADGRLGVTDVWLIRAEHAAPSALAYAQVSQELMQAAEPPYTDLISMLVRNAKSCTEIDSEAGWHSTENREWLTEWSAYRGIKIPTTGEPTVFDGINGPELTVFHFIEFTPAKLPHGFSVYVCQCGQYIFPTLHPTARHIPEATWQAMRLHVRQHHDSF